MHWRAPHASPLGGQIESQLIVVNGFVATGDAGIDLREEVWAFVLDQRAFGPHRLVVAFADSGGRLRGMAHVHRTDPPEAGLGPCIEFLGSGADVAIAFCDEPVAQAEPSPETIERFIVAREIATSHGIHLADWIACDDQLYRSMQLGHQTGRRVVVPAVVLVLPLSCMHCRSSSDTATTITIGDVPETVRNELAARTGRSLQEFVLGEITQLAERPSIDDWLGDVGSRKRATGTRVDGEQQLSPGSLVAPHLLPVEPGDLAP